MSVSALSLAIDVSGVSPRAKLILIGLANSAGEDTFVCHPSRKHLARAGDCSVDTVDRALRELVDAGLIEKAERERDGSRAQTSNEYRVFPSETPGRKNAAPYENPAAETRPLGRNLAAAPPAETRPPQPQSYAAPPAARDAAPYEPLSEPLESYRPASAGVTSPIGKEQIAGLIERAGDACNPACGSLHHGADINRLLRAGCDWEDDILPAVDRLAASFRSRGKRFGTWDLLREHALENRDRRLAGLPAPSQPQASPARSAGRTGAAAIIDRMVAEGKLA